CLAVGDFLYELACLDFWTPWYPLLGALDLQQQSVRHFEQIGMDVPCFDERFRCYQLHVGLVHLAYCTFAGLTNDLHDVAKRTAQVLGESA
ncbi:MAG TPA: hypothetical protein VGP46_00935, partial [Acidimicrobiales bacterium]|nr:hypothetical protein [Acidimicrobiales bacterium]